MKGPSTAVEGGMPDVAAYFVSDIHLRLDRPERARRFARWVEGLQPTDPMVIVGDLCDFWFASRQAAGDPLRCEGLRSLAAFRDRGGSITILAGNHDTWLGPLYERALGARVVPEPLELETHGLNVHLAHGHRLGARKAWKGVLESRAFLSGFGLVPETLAGGLKFALARSNERGRAADGRRHVLAYRRYAESLADRADLVVLGHIHQPTDDTSGRPRMVILGSWIDGTSYLRIDDSGATLLGDNGSGID